MDLGMIAQDIIVTRRGKCRKCREEQPDTDEGIAVE